MESLNEIVMHLAHGRVNRTGNLFQYDYGQKLVFLGVTLPMAYEVHFSNDEHGQSKTMIGDRTGVDIPDEFLLSGADIHVWVYLHESLDDGETVYHGIIGVIKRAKPTDQEPTPVQQSEIDQAIAALNAGVTEVEGIAEAMPGEIQEALAEAKASGEFDGFSPVVTITEITGGHEVTVTDADGDHEFDVMDGEKGDKGDTGSPGHSPVVTAEKVGKQTTISVDGEPIAEINDGLDGTKGDKGDKGDTGSPGHSPVVTASKTGKVTTVSVDGSPIATINDGTDGQDGAKGDTGATPVISIGTVSTLSPGASATASMDTTDPAHPVLSMGIPEGEPGEVTEAELFDATHDRWNEDNEPYLFRASGGDASVYEWERDTLIGGTVAWNQLHPANLQSKSEIQGIIRTASDDGTKLAYTGTATITDNYTASSIGGFVPGHKFLISLGNVILPTGVKILGANVDRSTATIIMLNNNTYIQVSVTINQGVTVDFTISPQIFDLTQMFGSTIADYIYTLEQGTAGAGIAWLKKHGFMTKPYYAYDAGTLMSVKAESHKTTGKNLVDIHITSGSADGELVFDPPIQEEVTISAKKNNVILSESVWIVCVVRRNWQNTYIGDTGYFNTFPVKVIGSPEYPIEKIMYRSYGITSGSYDLQVELGETATAYEPYTSHTYALDSSLELRGIPKIANGKLYYDGDVYESDGTVTRKYEAKEIKEADIALAYYTYSDIVYARVEKPNDSADKGKATTKAINTKFVANSATSNWNSTSKIGFMFGGADYVYYWFGFAIGTTLEQIKTALAGTYIVYELATPTTESADPFTNPQAVSPYGTEEYTDSSAVPIPVGHETKYLMDAFQYTEQKLAASQTLMELIVTANREEAMKATKAYTTGNLIIVNGTLYRATTSIANGANLTVGTNVTATNIATELANLA